MEYHVACAKGPRIPRDFFQEVYRLIHENGHWETVFYDNGIHDTPLDLLEFLTRKEVLPFSVWADDLLVGLLWLTDIKADRTAKAHFVTFGRGQHPVTTLRAAKLALRGIFSLRESNGECFIRHLHAYTPAENGKAVRLAKMLGFTYTGELPYFGTDGQEKQMLVGYLSNNFNMEDK